MRLFGCNAPRQTAVWYATALVVAVTGAIATLNFTISSRQNEVLRFNTEAQGAVDDVADRLDGYYDLLAAMRLTFQHTPPNTAQFAQFAEVFDIAHRYPGVRLLNYAPMQPSGEHPITMVSPIIGSEVFLGRDIAKFSGERGRLALEEARDSGKLMFSGNVIRPKGPTDKPAFSLRLPVYHGGNPPGSVEERRASYIGSLGVGVSLDDTLANMNRAKGLRLRVFDGGAATDGREAETRKASTVLWDSKPGAATPSAVEHNFHRNFFMGSRVWIIEATANPTLQPRVILIGGTALTVMLSLAALTLGSVSQLSAIRKQRVKSLEVLNKQIAVRNEELLRLASARSEFVANMSHELRTPLNAIMGFSELLQEGWMSEERKVKAIKTIYTSGQHLLSLVNDILDLSKLEAGGMELKPERVDIAEFLEGSLALFETHAEGHQITLTLNRLQGAAELDIRKVRQITFNLLSNAVKFTPDGGSVTLSMQITPHVHAEGMHVVCTPPAGGEPHEFMEITITDTGIGISPEGLGKLFTPFVQLDSEQARKHTGSGLGLVLVKQLVELHGGAFAVSSVVGEGTMFKVWIPFKEAKEPAEVKEVA